MTKKKGATMTPTLTIAPGPKPKPLLGNIPDVAGGFLQANYANFKKYGDIFRYQLRDRNVHIVSSPELAQYILVDHNTEFPKGKALLRLILGNGLVTNNDHDLWLVQRRMMQPMFHKQRLTAMGDKIVAACQRMVERWQRQELEEPLELSFEMMQVTLDIITRTMFSKDIMADVGRIGPIVGQATHFIQGRIQSPFALPLKFPTPANLAFQRSVNELDSFIYQLIEERRGMTEKPGDLLDMLLEVRDADTGEGMTDEQLRDEVITIFGAGHETTANTLSFAFYMLSQHPEILKKVQTELDTVLQGRSPTLADLANLPYSKQVLEETLRLYPAAPAVTPRLVTKNTKLNGFHIPEGAIFLINIFNIHRHPKYWDDPETFDPERWAEGENLKHRLAYMPFGAGPRKCIGNNLAMMEGQLLLAMVLQKFELRLAQDKVELEQAITLRPKGGLKMTLHSRTPSA
jgi:cytochrome P450